MRSFVRPGARGLATVAVLALGIAACGGGSSGNQVASLSGGSSKASKSAKRSGTSPAAMRTQLLAYAKCMRDNGVDFPDPTFDANGRPQFNRGNGQGFDDLRNSPSFDKARQACASKRPQFGGQFQLTPAEQAQVRKNLLKYAACMRSKGIDFPDPTFDSSGRPQFGQHDGPGGRDQNRNDPQFRTASDACRQSVGGLGRRGGFGEGPRFGGGGGSGRSGSRTSSSTSPSS